MGTVSPWTTLVPATAGDGAACADGAATTPDSSITTSVAAVRRPDERPCSGHASSIVTAEGDWFQRIAHSFSPGDTETTRKCDDA